MEFTIVSGGNVTESLIKEALFLDYETYPEEYFLDFDTCNEYFRQNNDIYTMILMEGKVIAYMNFSPITADAYNKLLSGKHIDTIVSKHTVQPYTKEENYGYLSSIVVKKEWRNKGLCKLLLTTLIEKLLLLAEKGIYFDKILADAISNGGRYICSLLGFTEVKTSEHGSLICELIPASATATELNRELLLSYRRRKL